MNGYKGKIGFYKRINGGSWNSVIMLLCELEPEKAMGEDYVFLTSIDVDVKFPDTRQVEIEAIEKQIEEERAASQMRINLMLGKIQELQALEHS